MILEFEVKKIAVNHKDITYAVQRKGLTVGHLTLEEPYNLPEAKCKTLTME